MLTSEWRHTKKWIWIQIFTLSLCTNFEYDEAIVLKIIQGFSFFHPKKHWKQKVVMGASWNNDHCQCMQNYLKSVKLKWQNLIAVSGEVIKLSGKPQGGRMPWYR